MHYYLYKITNKINQKFYIGVHSTSKLEDGYMGSGKNLKRAIKKYGKENFEKEILETFDNAKDMYDAERHLVNEEFIKRPDTYNLKLGGEGGWDHICNNEILSEQRRTNMSKVGKSCANKPLSDEHKKKISKSVKSLDLPTWKDNMTGKPSGFAGKHHSAEFKKKISELNLARVSTDERAYRMEISKLYDFSKRGELSKYAKHIGVSHTQARRILNQNYSV
jgi:group I intron endonuclease